MKKISTILLLLIMVLQTFGSFVIQAEYFLNRNYIARVFCINRSRPKLHCNGKCYLAKKLREEERQQQSPASKKERVQIHPYFLPDQYLFTNIQQVSKVEYHKTEELFRSTFLQAVFHPPTA